MKRGDTEPKRVLAYHKASFTELCPRVMELVRALDLNFVTLQKKSGPKLSENQVRFPWTFWPFS